MKIISFTILLLILLSTSAIAKQVTRTGTTEDTLNDNGVHNLIIFSGARFIQEDNQWKKIEEAKSLKGKGFNIVYLAKDENLTVNVIDFNYSSLTYNLSVKGDELNKDIPIKIRKNNESFNITKFKETTPNKDPSFKDNSYITNSKSKKFISGSETLVETTIFGPDYYLEFGSNSTTIILQDNITENLDDTWVQRIDNSQFNEGAAAGLNLDDNRDWYIYMKFNISHIPAAATVTESLLNLFEQSDDGATINIHHVYNDSWVEGNGSDTNCATASNCNFGLIQQRQPCGPDFNEASSCNLTPERNVTTDGATLHWTQYNISSMTQKDHSNASDINLSMALRIIGGTSEQVTHSSKETTNISRRPFLNITFRLFYGNTVNFFK